MPAKKVLTSVARLCNNMSRNGEKRENRQAFQQERHGSTEAPEVAASVVQGGEVLATLEDLGFFIEFRYIDSCVG